MLMESDRVANQFRMFVRALALGLDVLPLGLLDVPSEAKELIELMRTQARKSRFEVDPDDERVIKDVFLILNQLENGIVPDEYDIKRVLDSIGVKKWSDCNKEVKLLDAEIGLDYSNEEKRREMPFLSSLMGFMSYSRCVLFDAVDNKVAQQQQHSSRCDSDLLSCLNSDDFRCPISLEIMKEPVTIATGHTYDRSSILKWFRSGNPTCPKTGKRLRTTELIPNLVLKGLIQQYCFRNGIHFAESGHKNRDITRTIHAGSLAYEGTMRLVADFLAGKLTNVDDEERNKAAYEIRLLSKASIFNRYCLTEAGVIPYLLKLLLSKESMSQENAIAGLLNLSKHSKSKAVIVENGGLELIVEVLKKGSQMEAKQHAAATLFYLASIEDYRKLIGENTEALPALLDLIREGHDRAQRNALVAIYGLLTHPENHRRVLAAGAVPLLLSLLTSSEREERVANALAVLASLAEKADGAKAVLQSGALPQIVGVLDSSTSRAAKEQCVVLLLALCINGGTDVVSLLVKSPSLMGSLYSQLSEGTSRASKKASALIRILHEFYERNSSGSKTPIFSRERFVHVW
uniref:RING-type E3 ubiquitin transferase n=1 Tax=Manihot esculenta TaxID=3983 RepID=A0A2C9UT39_MANES